jgi:hypothetical protein
VEYAGGLSGPTLYTALRSSIWRILRAVAQMAYSSFGKQLYYLYLNADGDKRKLNVDKNNPDNNWNDDVRFLVVPAPTPVPAASFFITLPPKAGEF